MITDQFTKGEEAVFMKTIGRYRENLTAQDKKSRVWVEVKIKNKRQGIPTVLEVFKNRYHLQRKGK